MASEEQRSRKSTTPSKKIWYSLAPEPVELSPPRSQSSSSSRSSKSARSELHEYASPSQVSDLEEGPLDDKDSRSKLDGGQVATEEQPSIRTTATNVDEISSVERRLSENGGHRGDSKKDDEQRSVPGERSLGSDNPAEMLKDKVLGSVEEPPMVSDEREGGVKNLSSRSEVLSTANLSVSQGSSYIEDTAKILTEEATGKEHLMDSDQIKGGTRDLSSRTEVLSSARSSVSHASSSYYDFALSKSTISITTREASGGIQPLVGGAPAKSSSSSLDAPMETPHGSQAGSALEMDGLGLGRRASDERPREEGTLVESDQVDEVISSPTTEPSIRRRESTAPSRDAGHGSTHDELSQYPLDDSEETHQIPERPKSRVSGHEWVGAEISAPSHPPSLGQEGAVVGALESNGSLDAKYLERSSEMDPYASATSFHELQQEYTATQVDPTFSAHDSGMLEGSHLSQSMGGHGSSLTSSRSNQSEHSQGSNSYQDPLSGSRPGSISSESVPDDQRVRGSNVQLPLDLNSLIPLATQGQLAPSRSGVLLDPSSEQDRQMDLPSTAATSTSSLAEQTLLEEQTALSEPGIRPILQDELGGDGEFASRRSGDRIESQPSRTSFDKAKGLVHSQPELAEGSRSEPDFRSLSTPGVRRPDRSETRATRSSESHLIRPSDLYGSPKDQSLEDSLARKVAQLLIESGQIAFISKDDRAGGSRARSNSSSCSGSPDSIDGSLTPSSQKDLYAQGQDAFGGGGKESLSRQLSGRQSPASSVSSCTDSLALHVQQLLRESEQLRARAPRRDAGGYSAVIRQGEETAAGNVSDVSTSSSVRRIIRRVGGAEGHKDRRPLSGEGIESREGREDITGLKRHNAELRSSGHSSPRSQGMGSPYHSDPGRDSPRYIVSGSPSHHARSVRGDPLLLQQHQESAFLAVDSEERTSSPSRESLSRRVQTILAGTADDLPPRSGGSADMYHSLQAFNKTYQGPGITDGGPTSLGSHQMRADIPGIPSEGTVIDGRHQESFLGYQTHGIDPMGHSHGVDGGDSVSREVQAILMGEDAPGERMDRILQEAEDPRLPGRHAEEEFQPLPQSDLDPRLETSQLTAMGPPSYGDGQPPVMGSFAALERARANLEQQLQMVSERTFDHSMSWETPVKTRKPESDQSFDRAPPAKPYEAWRESRIPRRGQDYWGGEDSEPLSDPQRYGPSVRSSGSLRGTEEEFHSLPPSGSPSRSIPRPAHDGGGARPRSYPQADSTTRIPSYGRSQSIPGNTSIPRRSLPASSSSSTGPRTSQGRMDTSGRSMDFTSQLRTPANYYRDDGRGSYQTPYPTSSGQSRQVAGDHSRKSEMFMEPHSTGHLHRPKSATLPRRADSGRRSTFGSEGYATAEGTVSQPTGRDSLGAGVERGILHPYRPPGSAETMYTYHVDSGGRDRFSSTINSSTTMESTHIGSDDAQPPHFPAHALGSRRDPPPVEGSMIPRMSPRRYGRGTAEARGQPAMSAGPDGRTPLEHSSAVASGSSRLADTPLDLSQSRIRAPADAGRPLPGSLGRPSPAHARYPQEVVGTVRQPGASDVHYAQLPTTQTTQGEPVFQGGQRLPAPGVYSRQVLTDVLQDESSNMTQADEMWRQYQQRRLNETEGASSDDGRVQRLASLIHDPVGHTARNIIQGDGGVTYPDEGPGQGGINGSGLVSDRNTAGGSREAGAPRIQDEELAGATTVTSNKENVVATQTSFTSMEEGEEQPKRVRDQGRSSPKRQKTGQIAPPASSIPRADPKPSKPTGRAVARAVTPTKRKAQTEGEEVAVPMTGDSDVTTAESVLSDLSLDSEQLLFLLGSHGVKKLSSKLAHLQQRIERQREHHRRQTAAGAPGGGGKGRSSKSTKHPPGRRKTLPRPARSSTPAPARMTQQEPRPGSSELMREVADIVVPPEQAATTTAPPSSVSSLTTTQGTDNLDSSGLDSVTTRASATSESSTLVGQPVESWKVEKKDDLLDEDESRTVTLEQRRVGGERAGLARDDSEVEYRTSESDVSVLCSCRPELRRPKSATDGASRGRGTATMDRESSGPKLDGEFRKPVGAAPRIASRIPVKDKNGSSGGAAWSIPGGDNRNHKALRVDRTRPTNFPRGTAFTIDLSQDLEEENKDKDTSRVEKGVLDNTVPEKARNGRKILVERRGTNVANRANGQARTPTGVAWFQPFSKKMPWQEERPHPKPIIIAALQHDPTTGKVSLQDAFLRHRPDFISQCRERQRKMKLAAEERHTQASLEIERQRIFEEQRARKANPLAHPYSTQLHQPGKRNLTKKEMKKQTSKIYSRLPEVVRKQEENKKQAINETNRIRAQIYRKKLKDRLRAGWPHQ